MEMMEKAMRMLRRAQSDLDMAHVEACAALARFDAIHTDKSQPVELRLAATSLRAETLRYCETIRAAMTAIPVAALQLSRDQKSEVINQPMTLGSIMLSSSRPLTSGVVATSARHGRPICAAIH
jgi:hypothetical protein